MAATSACPLEVVLGASPWGLGGYLAEARAGHPLQYFEEALDSRDEARFGVRIGGAAGHQIWESLAVLCGVKLGAKLVQGRQMLVRVRSDSCAALRLAGKLASASPRRRRSRLGAFDANSVWRGHMQSHS